MSRGLQGWHTSMKIAVQTDGTETVAELIDLDDDLNVIGLGVAKRRKGERADPGLGRDLAALRAFEEAAVRVREEFERRHPGFLPAEDDA